MSDNNKFEQLIELFIAEDEQGAKDLFHEIVVEKSRSIYENLVDEEQVEETAEVEEDAEAVEEAKDEEVEESAEEVDEATDEVEESEVDEAEIGGDESDDFVSDIEADEQGLSMEGDADDEEIEDRVVDIENALEELKAEFDQLMGGDDADDGDMDMDMDKMDMDKMDMDDEKGDEDEMESVETEAEEPVEENTEEVVREYEEKAPAPVTGEEGSINKTQQKIPGGKPNSTAKAVISSGEEKGAPAPKATVQTDAANPKGATMSKA